MSDETRAALTWWADELERLARIVRGMAGPEDRVSATGVSGELLLITKQMRQSTADRSPPPDGER